MAKAPFPAEVFQRFLFHYLKMGRRSGTWRLYEAMAKAGNCVQIAGLAEREINNYAEKIEKIFKILLTFDDN
ncbi:MAG: hypothetical protein IJ281_04545 [Clostridia bacterium]|nr:hypothetical protein [Clostridia bacterium]